MYQRSATQLLRDRVAAALTGLASLGALYAFLAAIGPARAAGPDARLLENWQLYGFLVFAGLFALLTVRPRQLPGVWELVLFHKAASALTALSLIGRAADAATVAATDGLLVALTLTAYLLTQAYTAWRSVRPEALRPHARLPLEEPSGS